MTGRIPPSPLVSVVIPVFNAADTLAGTVASVQAQSLTDWEALLIEDGSTDESPAICARLVAMAAAGLPFSCTAYDRVVGVPARASRADLLKTNTVACSTAIYDRAHFGPRAMPALRRRQDFAFWLDLLRDTPAVLGLPLVLMTYRESPASLSGAKGRAAADTWGMYRQALGLSRAEASWYFGHYALRGLLRHRLPGLARRLGWLEGAVPPPEAG